MNINSAYNGVLTGVYLVAAYCRSAVAAKGFVSKMNVWSLLCGKKKKKAVSDRCREFDLC